MNISKKLTHPTFIMYDNLHSFSIKNTFYDKIAFLFSCEDLDNSFDSCICYTKPFLKKSMRLDLMQTNSTFVIVE